MLKYNLRNFDYTFPAQVYLMGCQSCVASYLDESRSSTAIHNTRIRNNSGRLTLINAYWYLTSQTSSWHDWNVVKRTRKRWTGILQDMQNKVSCKMCLYEVGPWFKYISSCRRGIKFVNERRSWIRKVLVLHLGRLVKNLDIGQYTNTPVSF